MILVKTNKLKNYLMEYKAMSNTQNWGSKDMYVQTYKQTNIPDFQLCYPW